MKIVIDIDEDYYEIIKHDVKVLHNDFKPFKIIANGTPLPKNHGDLISRQAVNKLRKYNLVGGVHTVSLDDINKLPSAKVYGDLISRTELLNKIWQKEYGIDYDGVNLLNIKHIDIIENMPSAEKTAEETNLTSEELFALDIEQNVKDIDSGEDDSYYRGRLAGMLSAYRILKGKPYEEKETDGESK